MAKSEPSDEQVQGVATVFSASHDDHRVIVHNPIECKGEGAIYYANTTSTMDKDDLINELWSFEGICAAQESDPVISYILNLMRESKEKPSWNSVALQSHDIRVLWGMWPRLRIWNGLLQRKFESPDRISVK